MASCLILAVVLVALAAYAAGIMPGTTLLLAAGLAVGYATVTWHQWRRGEGGRRDRALTAVCLLFLAWMALTAMPLPGPLAELAGYRRTAQSERAGWIVAEAARQGVIDHAPAATVSISRNRAGTWRTVLLLLSGLLAAGLAARLEADWRERFIVFLLCFGTAFAAIGFLSQWVIPQGKAIWWTIPVHDGRPVGAFLNRNHFAGFVALLCPLALARGIERISSYRFRQGLGWLLCFGVMSVAVVSSLSRGAFLAYVVGVGLIVMAYLIRRRHVLAGVTVTAAAALIVAGIVWLPSETVQARLLTLRHATATPSGETRLGSWRNSLQMVTDYPLLGVGAEGFRSVFALYKTHPTRKTFYYAENEYVQWLTDFGLIGVGFLGAFVVLLGRAIRRRWWLLEETPETRLGLLAALAVVATQAVVDFALRIPLYLVLVAIFVGLLLPSGEETSGRRGWISPSLGVSALLAVVLLVAVHGLSIYRLDTNIGLQAASPAACAQAIVWAPTQSQTWYMLGQAALRQTPPATRLAEQCYTDAARYAPSDYRLWEDLASLRAAMGDIPGRTLAYQEVLRWRPEKADRLATGEAAPALSP